MTAQTRPRWWGYVKSVIRAYPQLHRELLELRRASVSSGGCGTVSGHSGASRPVEQAALRTLPGGAQREHDAVEAAMDWAQRLPQGQATLTIIDLVYFRQTHTLQGAAMATHYSYAQAKRLHQAFLYATADFLRLPMDG